MNERNKYIDSRSWEMRVEEPTWRASVDLSKLLGDQQYGYMEEGTTTPGAMEAFIYSPETPSDVSGQLRKINQAIQELRDELQELRGEIQNLRGLIAKHIETEQQSSVIVLRSISREEAKREILDLFEQADQDLYYSDIAEQLRLDLGLVVEICHELEASGDIRIGEA